MPLNSEQLEARRKGVGGSDAAVVCGLSPWKTPYQLWLEKTNQVEAEDLSTKEHVHFGNVLEDVIAEEYMRRTGRKVRRINKTIHHPKHKWMLVNIDRDIVGEDGHLECKNTGFFKKHEWGEEGSDVIPIPYLCQCQHTMGVTGRSFMDTAVLIGGNQLRIYTINRDQEAIDGIMAKEAEFWRCVETMTPPPAVNLDDVKAMYPKDEGTVVPASPEMITLMSQLKEKRAAADQAKAEIDAITMQVQEYMGDNAALVWGDETLATWKAQARKGFDSKRLKADLPEIAEQYVKTSTSRVFLVK